jgi:hypothetical protein
VELKPGGKDIVVTADNRQEYVRLYTRWALVTAVEQQFEAFRGGFLRVGGWVGGGGWGAAAWCWACLWHRCAPGRVLLGTTVQGPLLPLPSIGEGPSLVRGLLLGP